MSKYIPAEQPDKPAEYRQERTDWQDRSQYGLPAKPKRLPGSA